MQLYSLMDFSDTDTSGYERTDASGLVPPIDFDSFGLVDATAKPVSG